MNKQFAKWISPVEARVEGGLFGPVLQGTVAYYRATGKPRVLEVMRRYIDYIDSVFGPEEGKCHGYPGHPKIELALCSLYDVTGEERYLRLAAYFINERGKTWSWS